jgi:hypothetical protein
VLKTLEMKRHKVSALVLFVIITRFATAKDNDIVMMWPSTGAATLKATFGRFRELSSYSGRHDYTEDVTVENVSSKNIPFASFTVYLLDKNKVRIADTVLQVKDLGPGQQVKEPLQFHASGIPASVNLVARNDASGVPHFSQVASSHSSPWSSRMEDAHCQLPANKVSSDCSPGPRRELRLYVA